MDRQVEPELMDEDTQARAYSEADFAAPHDRFVELFLEACPTARASVGPFLDLGCGPADVTVRVARACERAAVHGVDGSAAMLHYGDLRVRAAGLSSRITLTRALLPRDRAPASAYPFIFSNSLLHHMHEPAGFWSTVAKYRATGGKVFVMDLMRPSSPADVERIVDEHSAGEPEILRRDFHASLCAAFTIAEVESQLREAGLTDLHARAVSDRHLTIAQRS